MTDEYGPLYVAVLTAHLNGDKDTAVELVAELDLVHLRRAFFTLLGMFWSVSEDLYEADHGTREGWLQALALGIAQGET